MILSLNLYNTHASFLLTPLSTKSKEQQSILPLLCCLSQKGIEIRTRTTVLQAHTHRWLASFGGAGNGNYRAELLRGLEVIVAYQTALGLRSAQALVRLDGLSGNGAIVGDLIAAAVGWVMRGKDYGLLDLPTVKL